LSGLLSNNYTALNFKGFSS